MQIRSCSQGRSENSLGDRETEREPAAGCAGRLWLGPLAGDEGGGLLLGFRMNLGNELGMLSLTGDAELLEDYVRYSLLLRASFRF